MSATDGLADAERRAARDAYRAAGGSARRPLKSFSTADEKKARRLEHAERIHAAVENLQTDSGFADWLESLELNPDVSPLNAALLALQLPGEIAGTAAFWKRNGYMVRKGERASGHITAPAPFRPVAVFTAAQVGATDLAGFEPEGVADDCVTAAREALERSLGEGAKGRIACELAAGETGLRGAA